jgi:hypothetical protein
MRKFYIVSMRLEHLKNPRQGFSLAELAIWIMVIAIMVTAYLSLFQTGPSEELSKTFVTKQRLDKIELALEEFRVKNGRLPCPAPRDVPDVDDNGADDKFPYEEYCHLAGSTQNLGVVPVKSLGLKTSDAVDGWGRRFTYHVATVICGTDNTNGDIRNCKDDAYRSLGGGGTYLTVRKSHATTNDITTLGVYTLLSHGVNGDGAWMPSGVQRQVTGLNSPHEDENTDDDAIYWIDPVGTRLTDTNTNDAARSQYDDLVRFRTKDQIEYRVVDTARRVIKLEMADPDLNEPEEPIYCQDNAFDTPERINSVTEIIQQLDSTKAAKIGAGIGTVSENDTLNIIWQLQELCATYYPTSFTRVCPGAVRQYDVTRGSCRCPTLSHTYNGATDTCS